MRPDIRGCLSGQLVFDKVILDGCEFSYTKTKKRPAAPSVADTADTVAAPSLSGAASVPARGPCKNIFFNRSVFIKNLESSSGAINFIDQSAGSEGLEFRIEELDFILYNLANIPRPEVCAFDLKGKVLWHEGSKAGSVEAKGWVNPFKEDMEATVRIADIDGIYIYPYYYSWIDIDKARIQEAKLDFHSFLEARDNNLQARCHLELKDIVFKPRPAGEMLNKEERIVNTVVGAFKAMDNGKIAIDFLIRTKMDNPRFALADDIETAVKDKVTQARQANRLTVDKAVLFPGRVFGGTVKGTTDISRALIGGTLSLGKEIKRAFEVAFKKEK
jgi:hypothetical protein